MGAGHIARLGEPVRVSISPDSIFAIVTIAAMLGIAFAGIRAFYFRTQSRFVLSVIMAMIVTANTLPLLAMPEIDANAGTALVAVLALAFTLARVVNLIPQRRLWLTEAARDPLVLTSPFTGRWRAVIGGPDPGRNHHLIASDQRFAYDFVRLGGPSRGSPILAPVAGIVVATTDGQPDHRASLRVTEDASPLGNHVAIDSGRGVVFLCHLENGSVLVHPGDDVVAGAPIGRCGNSGRTSRPHLHVHAQDLPEYAFNRAVGIPIAFSTTHGAVVLRAGAVLE